MIDAVVRANVPYDIFASKFFKLGGRSGGVARGFCEHGIVYAMNIEGVDCWWAQKVQQTILRCCCPLRAPTVIVKDFAPQLARHINIVAQGFLSPRGGKIAADTDANIEHALKGGKFSIPGLLKKVIGDRYLLIDPFHRPNHHGASDVLHDPNVVEEFKEIKKNLEIQEQKKSLFKKFGHFLNSMSPDRFIKFLMYMTAVENIETNNRYRINLQKKLNTKFVLRPINL